MSVDSPTRTIRMSVSNLPPVSKSANTKRHASLALGCESDISQAHKSSTDLVLADALSVDFQTGAIRMSVSNRPPVAKCANLKRHASLAVGFESYISQVYKSRRDLVVADALSVDFSTGAISISVSNRPPVPKCANSKRHASLALGFESYPSQVYKSSTDLVLADALACP
jgi:small ligand-binding sensory domain FIST